MKAKAVSTKKLSILQSAMLLIGVIVTLYVSLNLLLFPVNGIVYIGITVPIYAIYMLSRIVFAGSASQIDIITTMIITGMSLLYFIASNPLSAWGLGLFGLVTSSLVVVFRLIIAFIPGIYVQQDSSKGVLSKSVRTKPLNQVNNKAISLYISIAVVLQVGLIYVLALTNYMSKFEALFPGVNLWSIVFIPLSIYIGVMFSRYHGISTWIEKHRLITAIMAVIVAQILSSLVFMRSVFILG